MPGPAYEPATAAPHQEEQAPSSSNSLALLSNGSYLKHEQPEMGSPGRDLSSVLNSKSPREVKMHKITNSVAHSFSSLVDIDEMDPVFTRLEAVVHRNEQLFLKALEDSITEQEWRAFLVKRADQGSSKRLESVAEEDELAEEEENSPSLATEAAFSNIRRKKSAQLLKRIRRETLLEKERAAAGATSSHSRPLDWSAYTRWQIGPSNDDGDVDLSRWFDRHHMYEGVGYGATITQALARQWSERAYATNDLSSGNRRAARRERRLQEGETFYLAIERDLPKPQEDSAASGGAVAPAAKTWSTDVKNMEATLSLHASVSDRDESTLGKVSRVSANLSEDVYSAIDTGTTLTIMDLADGTRLEGFNPETSVKIMGFNGSVSRSRGKGTAVGFGLARDGSRVTLRVPDVHNLPRAPNDLLSVSAMVTLGYEFHFTKKGSWIVTPEMDIIDIVERAGLYWLKWKKAITPVSVASSAASDPAYLIVETPVASDQVFGHAPPILSSESHTSRSNARDVPSGTTSKYFGASACGEAMKQTLGAEEAYTPNPSSSAGSADHKAQHEEESLDSRTLDDSFELHHMEVTVDQSVGEIDAQKDDQSHGVAGNRLRFLFNPDTDVVQSCGDEACFTCFSGTRVKESKVSLQLLHRRLGHFDSRVIERIVNHRAIDVTLSDREVCECQGQRQVRSKPDLET